MRIRLLAVGKPRDVEAGALFDRYVDRIRRLGVAFDSDWVAEVRPGGRFSDRHVREREAASLAAKLSERETVIALDRRGRSFDSEELSRGLESWATPCASFVVGGPLGLDPGWVERADVSWSLSRLTLPHELARVVVAEQLYRALTLLRRIPYHK
jgi:23S rRNA (pseudouridine1915-N3)-methyltransferase